MNSQSRAKSPERLRAMVAGTLANFQHPTLKHNLTALKALHHVAGWTIPSILKCKCRSSGAALSKR